MITASIADLSDNNFDFVIAGGGTAGLALAVRLAEDSNLTVAVLEAGDDTVHDPAVVIPGQFGLTIADPKYDWTFSTRKQSFANDREVLWSRGKGLGGSSSINFYAWIKPPAGDINVIEKLGNPGWNWTDYHRYSRKSEQFIPPIQEVKDLFPHTYDVNARGASGPIRYTITPHIHTIDSMVQETQKNLGLRVIDDPYKGDINGTWVASANLDPETWTRSYSANGYLKPHEKRENLTILTNALVSRVLFAEKGGDNSTDLLATGLEFIYQGKKHTVKARKEVILSTGVPVNPKILELSGIGRQDILDKIEVEVKLELPGVGENLQEHVSFGVPYELNPSVNHQTLDLLLNPEYAEEARRLITEGKGIMRSSVTSYTYLPLSSIKAPSAANTTCLIAKDLEDYKKEPGISLGLLNLLDTQLESLYNDAIPELEIAAYPGMFLHNEKAEPGKAYITFLSVLNHPVSRGSVHAKSNNPEDYPDIDPHYFEKDSDLELLVEHMRYIRRMVETEPLKSGIVGVEVEPGPACKTDEQMREYIKKEFNSTWHAVGTCSMLPREHQGVVDPELKVYGTKNLRIVDLSVIPLHIAAHTQATAYVIAEKGQYQAEDYARRSSNKIHTAADIISSKYRSTS